MIMLRFARSMGWVVLLVALTACSNGRGSLEEQQAQAPQTPPPAAPAQGSFSIGGTVTGLTGAGLVLQNNGGADLSVAADGPFTFAGTLAAGTAYNVTILTQPGSPAQTCSVTNGAGSVADANITNIVVSCSAAPRFAVGGAVAGLAGAGLVLQNNGGDDLAVTADGPFTFATPLANDTVYNVTVRTHPASQSCVVQNGSGRIANANIVNVQVSCANQFTVGGTASGLAGNGLVLQLNGGNNLTLMGNGPFAFGIGLANGASYAVTVLTHPSGPSQECTLVNNSGAIAGANVTNIAITCVTRSFTVGGSVSGLAGSGLAVRLNGTQDLPITGNGNFTFSTPLLSGTPYAVTFIAQPTSPLQTCSAANASGTVMDQPITSVAVSCATQTFAVGGTVSGLLGNGLRLRNSNGEIIAIAANGAFAFPTKVANGATYQVTVETHPSTPTQACTITNGTGTIGIVDVADIQVSCSTSNFTIGGTVENLLGSGLILNNNQLDTLSIAQSGPFTFPTAIPSGSTFNVAVTQHPTAPSQTCTVVNPPSNIVGGENVTSIRVQCTTNGFLIGGQVSGLLGSGLQLSNGADTIAIAADGPFRFPTALQTGATYNVTVAAYPTQPLQACDVVNGTGIVATADIATIEVRCTGIGPLP